MSAVVERRRRAESRWEMVRKGLLVCGILSAVLYVVANVVVPMMDPRYSWMAQTVSELSAIGAPTRGLWVALMIPYGLL